MASQDREQPSPSTANSGRGGVAGETGSLRHKDFLYFAAIGTSLALLGLSRLLFNLVGHQSFGLALVGRANVLLALAILVGLPSSAGLSMAISRFVPIYENPADVRKTLQVALVLALGTSVLVLVPAALISDAWRQASLWHYDFLIAALWAVLYAVYAVGRSLLFAKGRVGRVLALEILGFASFSAALLCATRWHAAWWLPFAVYPLPISLSALWTSIGNSSSGGEVRQPEFLRYALLALMGSVAGQGVQYGSTLVGGASSGVALAGTWATLVSLASPVLLLPRSLSTAYLPRLSALSVGTRDRFATESRDHRRVATLLAVPATGAMLVAGLIGPTWLFPSETGVDTHLPWLLLCLLTYATSRAEPVLTAGAALGYAGSNAAAAGIGGVICAVTWLILPSQTSVLVALAAGMLLYVIVVPSIALLIIRTKSPGFGPSFEFQPGDLAISCAVAVMITFSGSFLAQIVGIMIATGGVVVQCWSYWSNREPRRVAT